MNISVIGSFAENPRINGGGSATLKPFILENPLEELQNKKIDEYKKLSENPNIREVQQGVKLIYKEIRDKGYYLSINEHNAALFALAVPVISNSNKFVGAIVISGPISRFNNDQKIILLKLLKGQLKNIAMP